MADSGITELLLRWKSGDRDALNELTPIIYNELRRLATWFLRNERDGHTLQSTALVHEAYIRLIGQETPQFETRTHFFAVASLLIRRILVDHARFNRRQKRGGGEAPVPLADVDQMETRSLDLIRLDDALETLRKLDPRQGQIVEMKFFGGLESQEIADALGVSESTVKREWASARAWLLRELQ